MTTTTVAEAVVINQFFIYLRAYSADQRRLIKHARAKEGVKTNTNNRQSKAAYYLETVIEITPTVYKNICVYTLMLNSINISVIKK